VAVLWILEPSKNFQRLTQNRVFTQSGSFPDIPAHPVDGPLYPRKLVWGFCCQGTFGRAALLSFVSFFVRLKGPFLRPDPLIRSRRHAQELSRLAAAPSLRHAPPLPGHTLTAPSMTARLARSGDDDQRGARFAGRGSIAPQACIRRVRGPKP